MSDSVLLDLVKSFLAARAKGTSVSAAENSAWCDFYAAHDPMIRSIVKRHGRVPVEVDDLGQDVWFSLLRRLPKLELDLKRGTLNAYVAAVAHRLAWKYAHRWRMRRAEELNEELAEQLLDRALGPEPEIAQRQERELVQAVLAEFTEDLHELTRRIAEEYWLNERPISAIAAALEIPEERVRSQIRRWRIKLSSRLRPIVRDFGSVKN
jgi:RNA polymerase sigma factor (sigma-70 family)